MATSRTTKRSLHPFGSGRQEGGRRIKRHSHLWFLQWIVAALTPISVLLSLNKAPTVNPTKAAETPMLFSSSLSDHPLILNISQRGNGTSAKVCLKEACLHQTSLLLTRAFPRHQSAHTKESWCLPPSLSPPPIQGVGSNNSSVSSSSYEGLVLVKVPKAASSTCAGVVLRLANQSSCSAVQWEHREGYNYHHKLVDGRHFLLGSVRQPGLRAFSNAWYFMINPLDIEPTDDNVIRAMNTRRGGKTKGKGGYQYNYLSIQPVEPRSVWDASEPTRIRNPLQLYQRIRDLIRTYHFVIVVDRMDESLVVLAWILNVPLSHVVVGSNSKVAFTDGAGEARHQTKTTIQFNLVRFGRKRGQCLRSFKGNMSAGVRRYLSSPTWLAMNYADELLYRAANASLDRTIREEMGVPVFEQQLREYQQRKQYVARYCGERVGSGCTSEGDPRLPMEPCYARDFGCGYQCVDEAMQHYDEQQQS